MKRVLLILTLLLPMLGARFAAAETSENNIAYLEYKTTMYPFMRQNCAGCHSEAAVYPQGPLHSSKDPIVGFGVFAKLIDWKKPAEESRVFKVGSNMHYCKDYDANCDKVNVIVPELQRRLRVYVLNVQQKVTAAGASMSPGSETTGSDPRPEYNAKEIELLAHDFNLEAAKGTDIERTYALLQWNKEKKGIDALLPWKQEKSGVALEVATSRVNDDYVQVAQLILSASPRTAGIPDDFSENGAYLIEGVQFSVNGTPVDQITGWENGTHLAYFARHPTQRMYSATDPGIDPYVLGFETQFPLRTGLIPLKAGDKLSVSVKHLYRLDTYPSVVCKHKDMKSIIMLIMSGMQMSLLPPLMEDDWAELCLNLESNINLRSVAKSPILTSGSLHNSADMSSGDIVAAIKSFISH